MKINKEIWVPVISGAGMMLLIAFGSRTMPTVLIFIPAVVVAFVIYLSTAFKNTPDPEEILPIYLLALGIQCLHFAEEYVAGFNTIFPELFGQPAFPLNDWVIFNMVAYCLFIVGGIIIFKRIKMFMIIPLFFIVAGVFLNTIGHILLSLWQMKYTPGLITVFFYIPLIPKFIKALRTEEA